MFHLKVKPSPPSRDRARDAGPGGRLLGDGEAAGLLLPHGFVQASSRTRRPRGSRARRTDSGSHSPGLAGCSRGRAWRRRRRRGARRRGTPRASRARSRSGSSAPRAGRSRRSACPNPGARRGAGPRTRRGLAVEARKPPGVAREVRGHPVEDHADPFGMTECRRRRGSRPDRRSARWARSSRSPDSPRNGSKGCSAIGSSSRCVKPSRFDVLARAAARSRGSEARGCPSSGTRAQEPRCTS